MKEAEEEAIKGGGADWVHLIKSKLRELLVKEEELWQQCSKLHWLQNGDQNTRYFHGKASQRFRRNSIKSIRDNNGVMCEGDDKAAALFVDYFTELFSTSNPVQIEIFWQLPLGL